MDRDARTYFTITASYWGFTLTDGALRMLVVLYFHALGYSPVAVAMLFLLYEACGVVTNAIGGWLGARCGLNATMLAGIALQIVALGMLTVPDAWLSVAYVMSAQALSGIAKDLNKMSAKSSIKLIARDDGSPLFRWVAVLTGSKNALKGVGFFVGAVLLEGFGFRGAMWVMIALLVMSFFTTALALPARLGKMSSPQTFTSVFSNRPAINRLALCRCLLFASRDVWFVVALPMYLYTVLGWSAAATGAFLAIWIIGYGAVQAVTPRLFQSKSKTRLPGGRAASLAAGLLTIPPSGIAVALGFDISATPVLITGLAIFGVVFAVNSSLHSYLILAYADSERVAMSVGFYYMANAAGRLAGTLLSGVVYQTSGLAACLYTASFMVVLAAALSLQLPENDSALLNVRPS